MSISYVEIYNEMMYDLLATLPDQDNASCTPLVIAEVSVYNTITISPYIITTVQDNKGNVYVKGLSIRLAENEEEALNMLFEVFYYITNDDIHLTDYRVRLIE